MTKSLKRVEINEIVFFPVNPTPKGVICFVSFTYNKLFRINDCAIVTKKTGGFRLVYPIKTLPNGKMVNVIYPISEHIGVPIEKVILSEYEKFIQEKTRE